MTHYEKQSSKELRAMAMPDIACSKLLDGICQIVDASRAKMAVHVNHEISLLYWHVGTFICGELNYETYSSYGNKILATVSQTLTERYGRGFTYTALTRMMKVAQIYKDHEMFATLSQTLTWSHLIELTTIDNESKRLFYQKMSVEQHWSLRQLRKQTDAMLYERTLIAARPEDEQIKIIDKLEPGEMTPELVLKSSYVVDFLGLHGYYSEKDLEDAILRQMEQFILELGQGFAFLERQKRISVDATDYYIDLLFYHRDLNRLVAIDLKLGKFKPEYKGQMELYLKYLNRYERKPHEESPIGLLLCSEGNTEQVELMMLGEDNIRVAQYLTELPDKQWFIDKLNRSILIAQENQANKTK